MLYGEENRDDEIEVEHNDSEEEWEKEFPVFKFPPEIEMLGFTADGILKEFENEFPKPTEQTLFFVGNTNIGKTTLISKFLKLEEPIKPTLVLDYYYSDRKLFPEEGVPTVCNVWELGNGPLFGSSLETLNDCTNVTGVICVDLSAPQGLWLTLEKMLEILNHYAKTKEDYMNLKTSRGSLIPKSHPDETLLKPFPLPLIIVGCKYDQFQTFDPEKKRIVCQTLRYFAHINCAHLFFYSNLNLSLVKTANDILSHYVYGNPLSMTAELNYNKPLCIPPFSDSLTEIDPNGELQTEDNYKRVLNSHYPQEDPFRKTFSINPSKDPDYAEPRIDAKRAEKDEELEKMIKEFEEDMNGSNTSRKSGKSKEKKCDRNPKAFLEDALKVIS